MARSRLLIPFAAAFSVVATIFPNFVYAAGGSLLQPIIAETGICVCPGSAPDWGCALQVLQNVINTAITLGVILCVIYIAYAGFSLMISGGSAEARTQGKTRIMNAVVGIVVILFSWLLIDFVMKVVYNPDTAFGTQKFGPWNSIWAGNGNDSCILAHDPAPITTGDVDIIGSSGSSAGAQYGTSGTGGSCAIAAAGACSIATLSQSCFADRAEAASRVCNLESAGGQPNIKSGSDKLDGGSGPSYSVGLWQINLTTSRVNGLNCPAAFTRACQGSALVGKSNPGACNSSITNQGLYNQCVAAAQNPQFNTAVACDLYKGRGFQPWSYSAKKCSVSFK